MKPAHPALLAAIAVVFTGSFAIAQSQAQKTTGLDALDESRLQSELAMRGLDDLLEFSFQQNKTPEEQQNGIRTLGAMRQLSDPNAKLTSEQRSAVVAQVVKGIEGALPSMKDPNLLMQQAGQLDVQGIAGSLDTLEFWGENPRVQAEIRPIAETIQKIYDKAVAEYNRQADEVAKQIEANPNSTALTNKWGKLDEMASQAQYYKAMSSYALARSIDKADPRRKKVADDAIAYLLPYDDPQYGVQTAVRLQIAKLQLAKGDYAMAKKLFDSIETEAETLQPKPRVVDRYLAKYHGAEVLLLSGDLANAKTATKALQTWQKANLPAESQASADATARLLDYRIASATADAAKNPADKSKANDEAIAILVGLVKEHPQFKSSVFQQLLDRIPSNADTTKLDPLLLAALMQKGQVELAKSSGEKVDTTAIEGAINAGREIVKRKQSADPVIVEDAMIRLPFFLMKLDRKAEAAEAFLAYVDKYPDGKNAKLAVDNAGFLTFELRKSDPQNPALANLLDKFLPLAIEKFGHKELAYQYANRLRQTDQYEKAVTYYRLVPENDPNAVRARFFEMLSLKQQLDGGNLDAGKRKAIVAEIQQLADKVDTIAPVAEKAATNDTDRNFFRYLPARTAVLAADLAKRELKDPNRTLKLLDGFETAVKGATGEDGLLSEALFLRVGSYMDLGQTGKATENLVTLLNTKGGEQGLKIVFDLLQRLDQDYNAAVTNNDVDAQRTIAKNRAELSGYLVTWASNNKDPKIKQFTYKYRVFDASSKQIAANLSTDPVERKKGLDAALALYKELQNDQNAALYQATLPPDADKKYGDPQVMLGLALVEYDLGNFAAAAPLLSRLVNDRKLGDDKIVINQNGVQKRIDNDQFWEATFKQLDSFAKLGKAENADATAQANAAAVKSKLKQLYIKYGTGVGGKKWAPAFEKLRQQEIPDFKVEDLAATTQPAPVVEELGT